MPRRFTAVAPLAVLAAVVTACSPSTATSPVDTTPRLETPSSASAATSSSAIPAPASSATVAPASPSSVSSAPARRPDAASQTLVKATSKDVSFEGVTPPPGLAQDLRHGGYVIVFRYTGSGGSSSPVPASLRGRVKDDGQRISVDSVTKMRAYGEAYRASAIPVNRVISSEYYFVWQHAQAAFGDPVDIHRDLTGSLDFSDQKELQTSLQGLRDRTVTPPDAGSNTVLFTHQGKFDKAYGYYPDAGTTIIFHPDGSGTPRVVAVLSYDEFVRLVR